VIGLTQVQLQRPDLVVRYDDLTITARDLTQIIARAGHVFDRAGPVKVINAIDGSVPQVQPMTADRVVIEAHDLARPVKMEHKPRPVTLPHRVARLYLALEDWGLQPLKGITMAPLLSADGTMRCAEGYDTQTSMWCCQVPAIAMPAAPSRADAQAALETLRAAFRTFPFADAATVREPDGPIALVDISSPPGQDESAFLVALLTAVCRPSLALAPGMLISAPSISGAGSGKGLLIRAICEIAFGHAPHAFTACRDKVELEKRFGAALIEAAPVLFLDNVNDTVLSSGLLASTLTEPFVKVRQLGASRMLPLNPIAFVALTGNGVTLGEDLVRRFVVVELDPRMEDPESRPFAPGFLASISARRAELLAAALTIWRWGRQNEGAIRFGRPLGSYEIWGRWARDPLLALGCVDPVQRIAAIKARDPQRQRTSAIFTIWEQCHGANPVAAAQLDDAVSELIDPQGRGRQFLASALSHLTGTRAGGFVLTRQEPVGKWGAATYALKRVEAQV
jgi:putative DNA primase/helicase